MEENRNTFGVLCDSYIIKKWQYNCIKRILDTTNYKLVLLIVNNSKSKRTFTFSHLFFYVFKFLFTKSNISKGVDIRNLNVQFKELNVSISKKGKYFEYFEEEQVSKIKSHQVDFLLRFGFGIIRGEILNASKYGVWSFHHGDEQKFRGGPYCFWEIYKNNPNTCAILQKLTETLDGGIVLKKGHFKTISHSFKKNINQSLEISQDWPALICKEIENGTFILPEKAELTNSKIYKLPHNLIMLHFIMKLFINKTKHYYTKYLTFDFWHVGILDKSMTELMNSELNPNEITWLNLKSSSFFIADPFLISHQSKPVILLEHLRYNGFKGEIKAYSGKHFDIPVKELEIKENYHLSFPNPIKLNYNLYCLPESFESNHLFLYTLTNEKWEKHLIIENLKCIDPEIIYHEGYYYLFTTVKNQLHDTQLYIYYSENILEGWKEHALNPVVCDIRSARNAGKIFSIEGKMYRPGQNYSIHKEGSITISEIINLSPKIYSEKIVKFITPLVNSKYPDKIHTINHLDNKIVIDACKIRSLIFRPDIFFYIIKSKL